MEEDPRESLSARVNRQLQVPSDPATLKFAVELFQGAASGRIPGAHITRREGPGLQLTNVPMNRGMMAILRETQHLSEDDRQVLMMRVMHFGETIEAAASDPKLAMHVCNNADGFEVSNEFMEAFAVCKFLVSNDHIGADLDHLAALLNGKHPT